mmetsp:Transcript_20037/g.20367  ORF Transcript_20037/g.20367 Transcript_20037/m.20367 type:complete len:98 (+) Transcript_20037:68-361(+)
MGCNLGGRGSKIILVEPLLTQQTYPRFYATTAYERSIQSNQQLLMIYTDSDRSPIRIHQHQEEREGGGKPPNSYRSMCIVDCFLSYYLRSLHFSHLV